jgi:hypothetical protein
MNPDANTRHVLYEKFSMNISVTNFIYSLFDGTDLFQYRGVDYYIRDNNILMEIDGFYLHSYIDNNVINISVNDNIREELYPAISDDDFLRFSILFTHYLNVIISKKYNIKKDEIRHVHFKMSKLRVKRVLEAYKNRKVVKSNKTHLELQQ